MEHQAYWKPEKQAKEKKRWQPGKKAKKEIPEWKQGVLSHHQSRPSTKDRGDFPADVIRELISEANGLCQCCKQNPDTSTHHVMPRAASRGGRGVKTNGMRLCWTCHDRIQTNEEELQHWISVWTQLHGEHFWFDEQDWRDFRHKQTAALEKEKERGQRAAQLLPIIDLLTTAAGRSLQAKELRLIENMDQTEVSVFAKLIQDIYGAETAQRI